MIMENLFFVELLRPRRTQKFRDHAADLPGSVTNRAIGAAGVSAQWHAEKGRSSGSPWLAEARRAAQRQEDRPGGLR
jgi:hypothetical protein